MFKIGDFVYSPKYHHYGLIINYNNELKVFRKETVKGQSVFKPCNIRDEELYLKFDLKSYKWFFLLKDKYLLFIGSFKNNVFSLPHQPAISYNYGDTKFIFNHLLSMPSKSFADLKSKHIYWIINKENNTLGLCYYYGYGESLTSRKYYKLDLEQYSLYEQIDLECMKKYENELLNGNIDAGRDTSNVDKFVKSMSIVRKKVSGIWYGINEELYLSGELKDFINGFEYLNCINNADFDKINNYKYLFYELGNLDSDNIISHYISRWVQDGNYMLTYKESGYRYRSQIKVKLK